MYSPSPLYAEGMRQHVGPWQQHLTRGMMSSFVSIAWALANRAFYLPWHVLVPTTVRRAWFLVGATGGTNNVDMGVYDAAGKRIVSSGGILVGTASTIQYLDITDTTLPPGAYYIGIAMNGTTATHYANTTSAVARIRLAGVLQQDTAYPLPATATMVAPTINQSPICGLATTASP